MGHDPGTRAGAGHGDVLVLPIAAMTGGQPKAAHTVPVVYSAHYIFSRGDAVLPLSELGTAGQPNLVILEAPLNLTLQEARIARDIAGAATLDTVAAEMGIRTSTARSHLKRVFITAGVNRHGIIAL